MNKSKTLIYEDYDNADSYLLCLEPYGLKLLLAVPDGETKTEITIYGKDEDVDRFLEDVEADSLEPLDQMSRSLEFDEDYEAWLNNEVFWHKRLIELSQDFMA